MRSDLSALRGELEWVFAQYHGDYGLYYRDLSSGLELGIAADEEYPAGSNIKIAVLIELLRQVQRGELRMSQRLRVESSMVVAGSGLLRYLDLPVELTLNDLSRLMIQISDNVATNLLIDLVGMERVNALLKGLGLSRTALRRKMTDWKARDEGRDNTCTAAELGSLLASLWSGELLAPELTDYALAVLKTTEDKSRLRYLLPGALEVIHKSGTGDGFENDVGIVLAEGRPYFLGVLNRAIARTGEGRQAVALASGLVYRFHTGEAVPLLDLLGKK